jgi:hypothetical protein
MSNLMPEKRLNVKGHLVTKHVKVGNDSSSASKKLPRPKVKDDTLQAVNEAVGYIMGSIGENISHEVRAKVRRDCERTFSGFSIETLNAISEPARSDDPDSIFVYNCLTALAESPEAKERHVRHLLQMFGTLKDELGVDWTDDMVGLSLGLSFYDEYVLSIHPATQDLTTDERKPYYRALLAVTVEMQEMERLNDVDRQRGLRDGIPDEPPATNDVRVIAGDFNLSPIIDDPDMTDIVLGNLERLDDILQFIKDRHTADPALLSSYLNNPHPALAEGVL